MSGQIDFFGETDGKADKVFKYINKCEYEGATPTEVMQAVRFKMRTVDNCIAVLVADKRVAPNGQREATMRSTRIETVYKAIRFLTRSNPFARNKYKNLENNENVRLISGPFDREKKDYCPECGAQVMRIRTQDGRDELCDPQKRFVIFDSSEDLTGFEEFTGKFVAGRGATRTEADSLQKRGKCGKPWTILRELHVETCAGRFGKQ